MQRLPTAANRRYRSLDDLENLELAHDAPDALIAEHPITIDEVQRVPSLHLAIKRAVDRRPAAGQFLLTGSANLLLMHKVSETRQDDRRGVAGAASAARGAAGVI